MPKRLRDFSLREHLRLRPLTEGLKSERYARMDRRYFALPPIWGDLAALRARIRGRDVLATVAFEDPECLDMHVALVRRYVRNDLHVVADNSRVEALADQNRRVAERHGAVYLRLPANPWTERNDSRSHGIALNWLWHNLLEPGAPRSFGFLDDDLFPIDPSDPFRPLGSLPFYGDLRWMGPRWFLWAGFCIFRHDKIRDKAPDFGLDWSWKLDTGGANWERLYKDFDWTRLPDRPIVEVPIVEGVAIGDAHVEQRVGWIHEVGWATNPAFRAAKREAVKRLLAPHILGSEASRRLQN